MSHSELDQDCSLKPSLAETDCATVENNSPQALATADGAAEHPVVSSVVLPSALRAAVAKPVTSHSSRRHAFQSHGEAEVVATMPERLTIMLRSRQMRVLLTCCCLLMIGGLVVVNWQSTPRREPTRAELADLELTEFAEEPDSAPAVLDDSDPTSRPLDPANRSQPTVVSHSIRDSRLMPTNFVQPTAAAGPRGAWLTGQIESN